MDENDELELFRSISNADCGLKKKKKRPKPTQFGSFLFSTSLSFFFHFSPLSLCIGQCYGLQQVNVYVILSLFNQELYLPLRKQVASLYERYNQDSTKA
jgi:hypothetical protein